MHNTITSKATSDNISQSSTDTKISTHLTRCYYGKTEHSQMIISVALEDVKDKWTYHYLVYLEIGIVIRICVL